MSIELDGTSSDLARQLYYRARANDSIDQVSINSVPDTVQNRLTSLKLDWSKLPGLAQLALLWDSGFAINSKQEAVQMWTLRDNNMSTLALTLQEYQAAGCLPKNCTQPDNSTLYESWQCNGAQMNNAAKCVVKEFADDQTYHAAMWGIGGDPNSAPSLRMAKHDWVDNNTHYIVMALHTVGINSEPGWDACPSNSENGGYGSLVFPCRTTANLTAADEAAMKGVEGSRWLSDWLKEDYSSVAPADDSSHSPKKAMAEVSHHGDITDEDTVATGLSLRAKKIESGSKQRDAAFTICGRLRQLALFSISAMGLWPLILQVILVPESVFGDGHGDRYEQLSYFAFENDHYQVLEPRKVMCSDLQLALFGGATPTPTTDLLRAIPQATFENIRSLVVNQTTGDGSTKLSVDSGIFGLAIESSVCLGGVDGEGAIQIEALLSAQDSAAFGVDASCLQGTASHMRLRLQSTEFFVPDTMGELNPSRVPGAVLIVSLVGPDLNPVLSSCFDDTRKSRYAATEARTEYRRLVTMYSKQLLVVETCAEFTLFGGERDTFGCAYSALGTSGAVANLNLDGSQRTFSYPAPWRMIQCSLSGECSSLLFTQLWLSEWTAQETTSGVVLRQNFVNHKVNEVTVDSTFSIRLLISLQILSMAVTAYLTSVPGWCKIRRAYGSPWTKVMNATTSCTIAKVVRSSYNFILVAQMLLSMMQWRKQLTVDLLVGADTNQTVLRAFGCGTLVVVLAINIVFARAGDLKMQEMEPSFAHVVGFLTSLILFLG
ncbi:uncharacterized protein IUM83_16768 [Phytophthora cinnamomi]|uniref:uncharacterized protein n=1 Tax=Phytophthora cinnamomi TaxID=4785 RepID=UPI003559C51F|nr:hypothetical protein IUM83_16768 [Phytophthora cinnamomi]